MSEYPTVAASTKGVPVFVQLFNREIFGLRPVKRSLSPPAPVLRPAAKPPGIAGEIAAIAEQTCDPIARASLNGLVPRIARQETALRALIVNAVNTAAGCQAPL